MAKKAPPKVRDSSPAAEAGGDESAYPLWPPESSGLTTDLFNRRLAAAEYMATRLTLVYFAAPCRSCS
jgi:hypothetical protein